MKAFSAKRLLACGLTIALLLASSFLVSCAPNPWEEVRATIADESAKHYGFSLGFAGDICFADDEAPMIHLAQLDSTDISDGIDQRFLDIMNDMDLMWINNEFCFSDRGEALEGKMFFFRSPTEHVRYLHDMGIDIVGLANNHVYDFGEDAFQDTLTTLEEAGIPYVGAGRNLDEAMSPVYLETDGFVIGYVAASNAEIDIFTPEATETSGGILWCYDNTRFLEAIREASEHADYVIALPHWGDEHTTELQARQIEGAHAYIDAGADAVIGAHPHILQGMEYYNGKPILYSLGNFWFDDYDIDTLVAEIRFVGDRDENGFASLDDADVQVILHVGTQTGAFTYFADTPEWRDSIYRHIESISSNIWIDDDGVLHEA